MYVIKFKGGIWRNWESRPQQPDFIWLGMEQYCMAMFPTGKWRDRWCWEKQFFICEAQKKSKDN